MRPFWLSVSIKWRLGGLEREVMSAGLVDMAREKVFSEG